jgi:O-antigen/teichoic acid export membrane protein
MRLLGSARGAVQENPGITRFMIAANADVTLSELSNRVAPLIVGWIMGPVAAALYSVGQRGAVVIAQPSGNLGQAAYAELARLLATGAGGDQIRHVAIRTAAIAIAAALPIVILVAVFGTAIATLIGGKAFAEAGIVMLWLVSGRTILLAGPVASAALVAMGRPGLSMRANMACSLLLLPLLPVLMHQFGLSGAGAHAVLTSAAIATMLSFFAWNQSLAIDRRKGRNGHRE